MANGLERESGSTIFSEEELREVSGVKRVGDYVEVTCGCTSHRYGDAVGRLRVFVNGYLEITCECTPGCQEGLFLSPKMRVFVFVSFCFVLFCVSVFVLCMSLVCVEMSFFDVDGCHYGVVLICFGFWVCDGAFIQLNCMLICLTELIGLVYYTIGLGGCLFLLCAIVEDFQTTPVLFSV